MKALFKILYNIIKTMAMDAIFYVFDIVCTVLLGELNSVPAARCYEKMINAMVRLSKMIRKYVGVEKCNVFLDTVHERNVVVYYDIIDRMN